MEIRQTGQLAGNADTTREPVAFLLPGRTFRKEEDADLKTGVLGRRGRG